MNETQLYNMLYQLIVGLKKWEENLHVLPNELSLGQQMFIQFCAKYGSFPPTDLPSLIGKLQEPVGSWNISGIDKLFPENESLLDVDIGITIAAEDLLNLHSFPDEFEQSVMKQILLYCREHHLEKEYRIIRTFLSKPEHAVITYPSLHRLFGNIMNKELVKLIRKCYEAVNVYNTRKCPHCGWTLVLKNGAWRCNKENICHLLGEFKELEVFNEDYDYMRMMSGIQRYILLPGIMEREIANKLTKKGYNITMYPEIDRYDILIEHDNQQVFLDVKDYQNPFQLARSIYEASLDSEWNKDTWYVVPKYRIIEFPVYVKQVVNSLKEFTNKKITVISEQELFKKVGELVG